MKTLTIDSMTKLENSFKIVRPKYGETQGFSRHEKSYGFVFSEDVEKWIGKKKYVKKKK
jgi:hypothetical protein